MFEYLEKNATNDISIVEKLIDFHNSTLHQYDDSERQKIKQFYLSSTLTRLYAILEGFIHNIISDYLDYITELKPYSELSDKFKTEYRIGVSHILSKLDQRRYQHLNHENLIEWYHSALKNEEKYKIISEALTRHEENFRLNIIENLLGKLQLSEFSKWITFSDSLIDYFKTDINISEQLDAELKEFIQLRNDASHGNLDELEGEENLKNYCQLLLCLIKTITEFFRQALLDLRVEKQTIHIAGIISEVFAVPRAHILKAVIGNEFKKNDKILISRRGNCYYETIVSLQANGDNVESIVILEDNFELGIKLNNLTKTGSQIFFAV